MKKILITGASGNIGKALIEGLHEIGSKHRIIAGDFDTEKAGKVLSAYKNLEHRKLDFGDRETHRSALSGIDLVFLLRPPQLADVPRYFAPFVDEMKRQKVNQVVFLSVQGVEHQKMIPHHKIEKLITDNELEYAFLRPSYFMQNLTTTLLSEIREADKIFIPAGKQRMNWVDAEDVGLAGAHILNDFDRHKNKAYEITGSELIGFSKVAEELSKQLGKEIKYESPNLLRFFIEKRKAGVHWKMILVMIMLHYLPRFQKEPALTDTFERLTGKKPTTLEAFIKRETEQFSLNGT